MSGAELLERAISYAFGAVDAVRPAALSHPTPCSAWDLRALLEHLNDSLGALYEAADVGQVGPPPGCPDAGSGEDPTAVFRMRACRLLGALSEHNGSAVGIGGHWVGSDLVATIGAIEIAVHGWDVYRTCGRPTPIPAELALDMLLVCPMLVNDDDRRERFADRVPVSTADPSDWLVGYLGRDPGRG
jgi:uncharacterized protein (TIGR03086 family)